MKYDHVQFASRLINVALSQSDGVKICAADSSDSQLKWYTRIVLKVAENQLFHYLGWVSLPGITEITQNQVILKLLQSKESCLWTFLHPDLEKKIISLIFLAANCILQFNATCDWPTTAVAISHTVYHIGIGIIRNSAYLWSRNISNRSTKLLHPSPPALEKQKCGFTNCFSSFYS